VLEDEASLGLEEQRVEPTKCGMSRRDDDSESCEKVCTIPSNMQNSGSTE